MLRGKRRSGDPCPEKRQLGERAYTKEDLATLFLVAELKREGLSLPEVKCKLESELAKKADEAEATSRSENETATDETKIASEAETAALLSLREWRIAEENEAVYGRLLRAKALRASLDKDGAQEVRWLVWRTIERSFAENLDTLAQPRMQLAQMFFEVCEAMVNHMENIGRSESESKIGRSGGGSESETPEAKLHRLFSAMENESWPRSCIQQDFAYALETPGLDLAIELWLGPESFESVRKAFET